MNIISINIGEYPNTLSNYVNDLKILFFMFLYLYGQNFIEKLKWQEIPFV
jgi:hypothetical protein